MQFSDFLYVIHWWTYLFIIGVIFFPFIRHLFPRFLDNGYLFAKIIGSVIISYIVFVLGITHIAPFTQLTIFISIGICAVIITFFLIKVSKKVPMQPTMFILFLIEELLFFLGILFWSFIRAHQPDIFGLEKYMDFGFVNSILRSTYFPPKDMWYTPLPINYYYFGHLVTAVLTKLSGIPSSIAYNLMLATLFSFAFSLSFSLAGNVWHSFVRSKKQIKHNLLNFIPAGILGGFLVSMGGNLHTLYTLFTPYQNDNPVPFWQLLFSPMTFPNSYWYPNATRFIYHTIHEFPSYSFVVSDLHGHVLDIPVVLTALALLFTLITQPMMKRKNSILSFIADNVLWVFYGFLIGIMYMTNAWDGMIYTLVSIPVIIYKNYMQIGNLGKSIFSFSTFSKLVIIFTCFFITSLPFSVFFNPGALVGGIGLICAPNFLVHIGKLGPFIFESNRCAHSPLWQLLILYGFFIFWLTSFIFILYRQRRKLTSSDIFIAIFSGMAIILIIIPEFFYLRDIYTTYFRANTMFKLVYQAFILFSLAISYMFSRYVSFVKSSNISFWKRLLFFPYTITGLLLFILVAIYPYFSVMSYYNNLNIYRGLDGTAYLLQKYPTDAKGILWLNTHVTGQPVILEAQGDSYTEYARVSANTGLPTILGWPVHEWLWRGTYDIVPPRSNDIQQLYETKNIQTAKTLLKKYNVSYVFVGVLERTKYTFLSEEKFSKLGKVIFHDGQTTIYQISF